MFASEPQCAMTGKNTSLILNEISMLFILKQEPNLIWICIIRHMAYTYNSEWFKNLNRTKLVNAKLLYTNLFS